MIQNNQTNNSTKTPKVTGIGGIFFKSNDADITKQWYAKHLGLPTNDYGCMFESRDLENAQEVNVLQWSPFKKDTDYFAPSRKDYMINYIVQNIEGLVEKLKAEGVEVVDEIASYDYGKFVHIIDNEGNKIELWEPVKEKRKL